MKIFEKYILFLNTKKVLKTFNSVKQSTYCQHFYLADREDA